MNSFLRLTILLLVFSLQAACGTPGGQKKLETLNDAIDDYAYALRWGRIDEAVSYHINEEGERPDIDTAIMKSIRVTGFRIRDRDVDPEQTEATVHGELDYYNEDYGTLKTLEYTQHWWYEPESKKWFLDSDFPQFK